MPSTLAAKAGSRQATNLSRYIGSRSTRGHQGRLAPRVASGSTRVALPPLQRDPASLRCYGGIGPTRCCVVGAFSTPPSTSMTMSTMRARVVFGMSPSGRTCFDYVHAWLTAIRAATQLRGPSSGAIHPGGMTLRGSCISFSLARQGKADGRFALPGVPSLSCLPRGLVVTVL